MAASLNRDQSVRSKQPCSVVMATSSSFEEGLLPGSRGLHASVSITEMWFDEPRWGRGSTFNGALMYVCVI